MTYRPTHTAANPTAKAITTARMRSAVPSFARIVEFFTASFIFFTFMGI